MLRAVGTHTNTQDARPVLCSLCLSLLCHMLNPPSAERESANWAGKTCREKGSSQVIPRHFLSVLPLKAHCPSPLSLSHAKPGDCKMDSMPLSQNSKLVLMFGFSHISKWTSWLKTMWSGACHSDKAAGALHVVVMQINAAAKAN